MKRNKHQLPFHRRYNWQIWFHNNTHRIVLCSVAVLTAGCVALFLEFLALQNEMLDEKLKAIAWHTEHSKIAVDVQNLVLFGAPKEWEKPIVLKWKGKKL